MTTLLPESAPFTEEQRAWLNGFLSGLMGIGEGQTSASSLALGSLATSDQPSADTPEEDLDAAPWHDASLPIVDRMQLAENKPLTHRLMAAMAQLDCGSCGYVCKSYSAALASGEETNGTLCTPGGKETKKMIKQLLQEAASPATTASATTAAAKTALAKVGNGSPQVNGTVNWSRQNPFTARLLESRKLNAAGSAKDTRHVAIDLQGSGLKYQVGDALGVFPVNSDKLVTLIIDRLGADPHMHLSSEAAVDKTLWQALREDYCLKDPSDELLELLIQRSPSDQRQALEGLLDAGVPDGFDVLDALVVAGSPQVTATEFLETLSPIHPRLYSIASSMRQVGEQVHLTVGKVQFERSGRPRLGAASGMLAERLIKGDTLRVFVQPNHGGFSIPGQSQVPMIMVGPGTGIAPFMAFLQERAATKATGKNWLFFGDQHAASDFLYAEELQRYVSDGLLTRLDTAFSRDHQQKVYVQDRMREHAAELWQWLQAGAHFYVCGDAARMAQDVDRTLHAIVAAEGAMDEAEAKQYVRQLAQTKRYVRDVY